MKRDTETRECPCCHGSFVPTRADAVTCSARCRQRRKRGSYVISAEDRAAMERVAQLVPVPVPVLTPDQVRAHILAHARHE